MDNQDDMRPSVSPPDAQHASLQQGTTDIAQPSMESITPATVVTPQKSTNSSSRFQGIIWLFFGVAFMLAGFIVFKISSIPGDYIKTTGVVTHVKVQVSYSGPQGRPTTTYIPTVSFTSSKGSTQVFTSHESGLLSSTYSQGETVDVAYTPEDPTKAKINDKNNQIYHKVSIGVMAVAIIMLAAGVILRRK